MWNYKSIAAIAVLYIVVNIYNYPKPIITATNNLIGFILFRIGYRDLNIYFSNKLNP